MARQLPGGLPTIRDLQFPEVFSRLWNAGRWRQPEDRLVADLIPWLQGPIEFIEDATWLLNENQGLIGENPDDDGLMREYRGSRSLEKPDLPWLDVERAIVLAVNRNPGDDLAIAIDFRSSSSDPRVVATYWCDAPNDYHVEWREVSPTLTDFLKRLELLPLD